MPSLGKTVGYTVKSARLTARGGRRATRWVTRRVLFFRDRGAAGEVGMMRLLDLHALSCAGDTLVTMGLAGTVFFAADPGAARSGVALYLLMTMAPFALIAPVVGPVLDRFRHGRRWALAVTMLGRAFLAWLISDYIHQIGLYPAAFGVLILSRAYGVARSAAVPRLLPASLRLSEAGARASAFGTLAGAAVVPIGLLTFKIGPQWPLRVSAVLFLIGTVVALRLPPRADSDPPETVPAVFRRGTKALTGRLVLGTLAGAAILRWAFGFLALFLAFAVKSKGLPTTFFGAHLGEGGALALVTAALGLGAFLATAVGTQLHIHRPALLQAGSMLLVALLASVALLRFSLGTVTLLCLGTAMAAGLAKLAVDAVGTGRGHRAGAVPRALWRRGGHDHPGPRHGAGDRVGGGAAQGEAQGRGQRRGAAGTARAGAHDETGTRPVPAPWACAGCEDPARRGDPARPRRAG